MKQKVPITPDVIVADAVTKRFAGREVVKDLTFRVRRGEIFALLGPNGAGKTTCVRMLTGIIRPDTGRITVSLDGRVCAALPPAQGAYLPEERGLYREIPVFRTLVHFGRLRGLDRHDAERRARRWLERMGLADRAHERVDALSKGNQQRVQFIATVLHGPALAILDEPFTGLDPISQEFFLDLVQELRDTGTTVVLSAHQMDLVERVADRVLLMNHGRDILSGSVAELHARLDPRPRIRLALLPGADPDPLREDPDVDEVSAQADGTEVLLRAGSDVSRFFARTLAAFPVQGISTEPARLHDVFVRAVREDDAEASRQDARGSADRATGAST
jgi:ABC-2 type transport system ATP-binding protein